MKYMDTDQAAGADVHLEFNKNTMWKEEIVECHV